MKPFDSLIRFVVVIALVSGSDAAWAQKRGENILKDTGIVSNLVGDVPSTRDVILKPPKPYLDYEVKVNFFKVETATSVIDDFIDYLNQQAKEQGRDPGSRNWDVLRGQLMEAESEAEFEVFDENGESVGKASSLGVTTYLRTVKFSAATATYRVRIRCSNGAGVYHLTFEYD